MKKALSGLLLFCNVVFAMTQDNTGYVKIKSLQDVQNVYPTSVQAIQERQKKSQEQLKAAVDQITALAPDQLNKNTVLQAYDSATIFSSDTVMQIDSISQCSPEKEVREVGVKAVEDLQKFAIETVSGNRKLFQQFQLYADTVAPQENLTGPEQLFLTDILDGFKRDGMMLQGEEFKEVQTLKKDLAAIGVQFIKNINDDTSSVEVDRSGLEGIKEDFIDELEKTPEEKYVLKADYPTVAMVMDNCSVASTREQLWRAYQNRSYPQNDSVLETMMKKRHELAQRLGFKSYAHYAMADKMIADPDKAKRLQADILPQALSKTKQMVEIMKKDLPESVALAPEGQFEPWDLAYTRNQYNKIHNQFDELEFAEYFSMEHTIEGLFDIYKQFFGLKFENVPGQHGWHEDVTLVKVQGEDGTLLGYVYLDMFPREEKFNHAQQLDGVNGHIDQDGKRYPAVCVLMCNFTKPTKEKPSLLLYDEVVTFFHEFGHGLHTLLGAQKLANQSGAQVKEDFVEMPSQFLENWLEDENVLCSLGRHYKTGQPVPKELVQKKLQILKDETCMAELRQIQYGLLALDLFDEKEDKNKDLLVKKNTHLCRPFIKYYPDFHPLHAWMHLDCYGPCYYGYLWARMLGADIFKKVKEKGLLNREVGRDYVEKIIAPGGSRDPQAMVCDFLGREPNQEAFLEKSGFATG